MNSHFQPPQTRTTQAAEGLPRRAWTVAQIEAMVDAGFIEEDDHFELIGGEIVPMSPKGIYHERVKAALNIYWARRLPAHVLFVPETTYRLDTFTFLEPDFVFYDAHVDIAKLAPANTLLAVEVAHSSLGYDLGRKARIYSNFGIKRLWVIDAETLNTHVFEEPGIDGYRKISIVPSTDDLVPSFAPELKLKLSDLKLA